MNFVVTGGAGFIGSHLVKYLVKLGHQVIVIDNLRNSRLENLKQVLEKIEFYKVDIRDYDKMKSLLKNADGVFHEAALTSVPESYLKIEEYYDINVHGTENVLRIAKEFGFKLVYASSSSIYGDVSTIPIKENFQRNPINPYGKTKLEDEFIAEKYSKLGVKVIGLRYFNVYGIGQTGSYAGVITKFMHNIRDHKSLVINGDGTQIRDFIYVEDIAEANLAAMESKIENGFFNIGTGIATTINKLAKIMISVSNSKVNIIFSKYLEGDIKKSQADVMIAKKTLGWKFKTRLETGLSKILLNKNLS